MILVQKSSLPTILVDEMRKNMKKILLVKLLYWIMIKDASLDRMHMVIGSLVSISTKLVTKY